MQVATFIIDEQGDLVFLVDERIESMFEGEGVTETKRASHVEPDCLAFRLLFRLFRTIFGDKGRMSEFTRNWPCLWRVDTRPTAGVILPGRWKNRQEAIDAEIAFLNDYFIRRETR